MKIIGGRDYYDGAGFGVDESILFLRKDEEMTQTAFELPKVHTNHRRKTILSFHHILVAGKVYPMLCEEVASAPTDKRDAKGVPIWSPDITAWHYDLAAAMQSLERMKKQHEQPWMPRFLVEDLPNDIERHFRETEKQAWTDWMLEHRVVTGHVFNRRRNGQTVVRINFDGLADLEFYRVMDPATIHMEIANFIGGVLPSSKETIELSNESRIRKAGFDQVSSFRKAPGEKKRRKAQA